LRPKVPRLATRTDAAEEEVLAQMHFPAVHWTKLHGTNPIERLTGEIKRRTDVVGIVPNEAATVRRTGHPAGPLQDPGNHRRRQQRAPVSLSAVPA
jgi:transposase-like protein